MASSLPSRRRRPRSARSAGWPSTRSSARSSSEVVMARRDSAEVSRARYTVTGSAPACAVGIAGAVAPVGSSEVSMALQVGKGHYHNRFLSHNRAAGTSQVIAADGADTVRFQAGCPGVPGALQRPAHRPTEHGCAAARTRVRSRSGGWCSSPAEYAVLSPEPGGLSAGADRAPIRFPRCARLYV
jgi:hypothetical protein